MFAEPVASGNKRPNFRVKVIGNVPRFVVKTNVPEDRNNGRIDFNMDLPTFGAIMSRLQKLADGGDDSFTFEYNDDFVGGKKLDKPVTVASVKGGRDRETGRIYIAVLGYNRPKVQFFFGPSKFHAMKHGDGSDVSAAEVSNAYCAGFITMYSKVVAELLVSEFNEDAKNVAKAPGAQGDGGQGGGGYQNRGDGGGQNYNQNSGGGAPAPSGESFKDAGSFDDFL
jgi:hypothetical protein